MQPGWQPANELERGLLAATEGEDGREYARLVSTAPLYVPELPPRGSEDWRVLAEQIPAEEEWFVLAYTSPEALAAGLGRFARGHVAMSFSALRDRFPGAERLLFLDPGLPIGATLPLAQVVDIAEGKQPLLSDEEMGEMQREAVHEKVREICLDALGPPDWAPGSELENELVRASGEQNGQAFLAALMDAELLVLTTRPDADPLGEGFPWHVLGPPGLPVIVAATAPELLKSADSHVVRMPFVLLLANWPGEEFVLAVNPGTRTELILPGDIVLELMSDVAEVIAGDG
ncbi:SseB family protein [Amycolatopsis acidicola]|uniref:SseB family protein n=1 Tax=Amycolatopsis acidicola TaxID=2596893 RepID=A0A5N0VNL2_9PSEU|nr:SseB family protein [Amycolatopsis acidicola]KAA9166894.1 SseB family protein [Amycolatopsis acidicola]